MITHRIPKHSLAYVFEFASTAWVSWGCSRVRSLSLLLTQRNLNVTIWKHKLLCVTAWMLHDFVITWSDRICAAGSQCAFTTAFIVNDRHCLSVPAQCFKRVLTYPNIFFRTNVLLMPKVNFYFLTSTANIPWMKWERTARWWIGISNFLLPIKCLGIFLLLQEIENWAYGVA